MLFIEAKNDKESEMNKTNVIKKTNNYKIHSFNIFEEPSLDFEKDYFDVNFFFFF